jgi:hypothetical protein
MKEMADGTLRVQIDIDPRFRAQFFEMFGQIDMPVAIAPLVADFEKREPEPEKPKGGALAKLAGMLCADPEFWKFLTHQFSLEDACESDETAATVIREVCEIESRSELDWHTDAADRFHAQIRGPWIKWRVARGLK